MVVVWFYHLSNSVQKAFVWRFCVYFFEWIVDLSRIQCQMHWICKESSVWSFMTVITIGLINCLFNDSSIWRQVFGRLVCLALSHLFLGFGLGFCVLFDEKNCVFFELWEHYGFCDFPIRKHNWLKLFWPTVSLRALILSFLVYLTSGIIFVFLYYSYSGLWKEISTFCICFWSSTRKNETDWIVRFSDSSAIISVLLITINSPL